MDYHAFVPPSAWEFSVKPEENNSKSLILGIMDDVDILTKWNKWISNRLTRKHLGTNRETFVTIYR